MPVPKRCGSYRQAILVRARGHAHAMPVPGPFTGFKIKIAILVPVNGKSLAHFRLHVQQTMLLRSGVQLARCGVSKLFVRHHLLTGREEMSKTPDTLVHVVHDLRSHPFSLAVVSLQLTHQSSVLQHLLTGREEMSTKDRRHARPHCR